MTAWRNVLFAVVLPVVLITELVMASVLTFSAESKATQSSSLRIAGVGDSYTAAPANRAGWPRLLAERRGGWVATSVPPGAGYHAVRRDGCYHRAVWPTVVAERSGCSVANFALPGSGYDADGQGGYAFTYQVDRAQGVQPKIVLFAGGPADTSLADTARITVGAIDAINK